MSLQIGSKAPDFSLPGDGETAVSLSDYLGKKVVLFFYPKDMTPGCTNEAIGFTDAIDEFAAHNTAIIGMSKDSAKRHDKFVEKHDLKVRLASDEEGNVIDAYGVWVEKSMYGRKYMGIERATYLIDEKGNIQQIWRKVKVKGHVDAVLEAVKGS